MFLLQEFYIKLIYKKLFTKQSKNKSTGIRNAIFYGISIILIYVILGTLVTAIFGSDALNALSTPLMLELQEALGAFDRDDSVVAIVLTGSEKAFAAGADIKEMSVRTFPDTYYKNMFRNWTDITKIVKPTIAAVSGYALGGGCELAMMCDFIIAGESAKFGQPEIKLGIIPGAGGTQRLPRAVGKSKAMDMALTGRMMNADEAERSGLVSRVVPDAQLMDEVLGIALTICSYSVLSVMAAKEAVNQALEARDGCGGA